MAATKNTKAFYNTEIPGDWDIVEIGEIINYKKGFPFKNGDYMCNPVKLTTQSGLN